MAWRPVLQRRRLRTPETGGSHRRHEGESGGALMRSRVAPVLALVTLLPLAGCESFGRGVT